LCKRLPRNVCLCEGKAFEHFEKFKHTLNLIVVANKPITDFTTGLYDQAGNVDKGIYKPFEFHSHNGLAQGLIWHEQSIPGFQGPGQGGDDHICPIGN